MPPATISSAHRLLKLPVLLSFLVTYLGTQYREHEAFTFKNWGFRCGGRNEYHCVCSITGLSSRVGMRHSSRCYCKPPVMWGQTGLIQLIEPECRTKKALAMASGRVKVCRDLMHAKLTVMGEWRGSGERKQRTKGDKTPWKEYHPKGLGKRWGHQGCETWADLVSKALLLNSWFISEGCSPQPDIAQTIPEVPGGWND